MNLHQALIASNLRLENHSPPAEEEEEAAPKQPTKCQLDHRPLQRPLFLSKHTHTHTPSSTKNTLLAPFFCPPGDASSAPFVAPRGLSAGQLAHSRTLKPQRAPPRHFWGPEQQLAHIKRERRARAALLSLQDFEELQSVLFNSNSNSNYYYNYNYSDLVQDLRRTPSRIGGRRS